MGYRVLADCLVLLHLAFVVFVVAGGVLILWRPSLRWIHLPAAAWGALIEFTGWICPLTPWEQALRLKAGQVGYAGGFIAHYRLSILYPTGAHAGRSDSAGAPGDRGERCHLCVRRVPPGPHSHAEANRNQVRLILRPGWLYFGLPQKVYAMTTKVQRWGNSQGLRLSRQILEDARIAVGNEVDVLVQDGTIMIAPVRRVRGRYSLSHLVARMPKYIKAKGSGVGKGGRERDLVDAGICSAKGRFPRPHVRPAVRP